jgi:hypothetical protein
LITYSGSEGAFSGEQTSYTYLPLAHLLGKDIHLVRLNLSAESAAIQQCFSLMTNQRTVLSATINQRNEQADHPAMNREQFTSSRIKDKSYGFQLKASTRQRCRTLMDNIDININMTTCILD